MKKFPCCGLQCACLKAGKHGLILLWVEFITMPNIYLGQTDLRVYGLAPVRRLISKMPQALHQNLAPHSRASAPWWQVWPIINLNCRRSNGAELVLGGSTVTDPAAPWQQSLRSKRKAWTLFQLVKKIKFSHTISREIWSGGEAGWNTDNFTARSLRKGSKASGLGIDSGSRLWIDFMKSASYLTKKHIRCAWTCADQHRLGAFSLGIQWMLESHHVLRAQQIQAKI